VKTENPIEYPGTHLCERPIHTWKESAARPPTFDAQIAVCVPHRVMDRRFDSHDELFAPKLFPGQHHFLKIPASCRTAATSPSPFTGEVSHFLDWHRQRHAAFPIWRMPQDPRHLFAADMSAESAGLYTSGELGDL